MDGRVITDDVSGGAPRSPSLMTASSVCDQASVIMGKRRDVTLEIAEPHESTALLVASSPPELDLEAEGGTFLQYTGDAAPGALQSCDHSLLALRHNTRKPSPTRLPLKIRSRHGVGAVAAEPTSSVFGALLH